MALHSDLLKEGIIERLQEYDAYIDDELPDYIMVMIANKKTVGQIKSDLQLFLGDNTNPFITWLKDALENPDLPLARQQTPGTPLESTPSPARPESMSPRRLSTKRSRSPDHQVTHRDRSLSPPPPAVQAKVSKKLEDDSVKDTPKKSVQKIRLSRDPQEKRRKIDTSDQPWRTKDQDLRNLIRRRKAETHSDGEDEEDEGVSVGVSSVVQLPVKQERPKRSGGTSRLLQKAISDIHGVSSTGSTSSLLSRKQRKRDSERKQKKTQETQSPQEVLDLQEPDFVDEFREEEKIDQSSKQTTAVDTPPTPPPAVTEEEEIGAPPPAETGVKKKKSIKDRLDLLPEDDQLNLTEVEVATLAAVRKVLPSGQVDLRQFLTNKKERNTEEKKPQQGPTRFIVTLNNTSDQLQRVTSSSSLREEQPVVEDEEEVSGSKGLSQRCKFWPNCKNGESCPYHHPTVPCRLFPNCKYGQKCCFVHPLCKYDGRCTKPGCYYLHTVPKPLAPQMQSKVLTLPMASPFSPIASIPQFSYGGDVPRGKNRARFPNKSALTWTPGKSTSERHFAVPNI